MRDSDSNLKEKYESQSGMIALPEFKKTLGPLADKLTDEQIIQIRDAEYQIADAIFDMWLTERNKQV